MKFLPARPTTSTKAVVAAGTAGLLVVGAIGVVLVRNGGDSGPGVSEADRVLQSVSATVGSDGTITALDGTVVAIDGDGRSSTTETSYSPEEMAGELPVRVRTSWRTEDGSGTDLDDLEGQDGRVEIALTVENLTVEPQQLTYDVAGNQRTRSALVGVPLSVVASAGLGDVDPGTVVTEDSEGGATNGVLSRTESGETQVQWATILAPPQLGTTATLRLVVDAEDFSAPDFDLSVQQGLVTDPSLGALVDAAFNPASSEELQLQQRTISLIGEVNTVIARAGDSISNVRRTLRTSAETIGEKTVADLQSSTRSIARSMAALGQAVDSLGQDLSSTLESTGSTAIQQLETSVAGLDSLLGDTSQQVPTAQVRGAGCETDVALPGRSSSLYGSLLSVSGQLDGYARATQACKAVVQQRLIAIIGTADNYDADDCKDATGQRLPEDEQSVTCTLFAVAKEFENVGATFLKGYDDAKAALGKLQTAEALGAAGEVSAAAVEMKASATAARARLGEVVVDQLEDVDRAIDTVDAEIGDLNSDAQAGKNAATALTSQITVINLQNCASLSAASNSISQQMVGADCLGQNPVGGSLREKSIAQESAWQGVIDATGGAGSELRSAISALRADAGQLRSALTDGYTDTSTDPVTEYEGIAALLDEVVSKSVTLDLARNDVVTRVISIRDGVGSERVPAAPADDPATQRDERVEKPGEGALGIIQRAFAVAEAGVSGKVDVAVATQSTRLIKQTAEDAADIGTAFERSAAGLTRAGAQVRADGKRTVDEQRAKIAASKNKAEQALTSSVQSGLEQIRAGVAGSTRDTEAASTLLQADLRNVLLDLGTRDVDGSGLLGSMAASAATAGTADVTLAAATDTTTSFAGVRDSSIAGLFLRQAQADAAFARQAEQPPFGLDLPSSAQHRTVYSFHVRTGS